MSVPKTLISKELPLISKELLRLESMEENTYRYLSAAIAGAQLGNEISDLVGYQRVSQQIENLVYNLTLIYGEKFGGVLFKALTPILTNTAIKLTKKALIKSLAGTITQCLTGLISGGTLNVAINLDPNGRYYKDRFTQWLARHISKSIDSIKIPKIITKNITEPVLKGASFISESMGESVGFIAAERFAKTYIQKNLSNMIEAALLSAEDYCNEMAEHETYRNTLRSQLMTHKLQLLYPEDLKEHHAMLEQKKIDEKKTKLELDEARSKSLARSYLPMRMAKRLKHFTEDKIDALRNLDRKALKVFFSVSAGFAATTVAMRKLADTINQSVHKNLGTDGSMDFSKQPLDYFSMKRLFKENKIKLTGRDKAKMYFKSTFSWGIYLVALPVRAVIWTNGTAHRVLLELPMQYFEPKINADNHSKETALIAPFKVTTPPESKFLEYLQNLHKELSEEIESIQSLIKRMKDKINAVYDNEVGNTWFGRLNPSTAIKYYDKVNEIENEFNYNRETKLTLENLQERATEVGYALDSMKTEQGAEDFKLKHALLYKRLYQQCINHMKEKLRPELEERLGYCRKKFLQIRSDLKCFNDVYHQDEIARLPATQECRDLIMLSRIKQGSTKEFDRSVTGHLTEMKIKSEHEQLSHQEAQRLEVQNQKFKTLIAKRKLEKAQQGKLNHVTMTPRTSQ